MAQDIACARRLTLIGWLASSINVADSVQVLSHDLNHHPRA